MLYDDNTIIEALILCLNKNKIEAYPPTTKKGRCTSNYVVIKSSGASKIPGYTSEVHYYDVLCYVPQNKYTELEKFKKNVKEVVEKNLFPRLVPTGSESIDYFDEDIGGFMSSIMYKNNVRNNHLR